MILQTWWIDIVLLMTSSKRVKIETTNFKRISISSKSWRPNKWENIKMVFWVSVKKIWINCNIDYYGYNGLIISYLLYKLNQIWLFQLSSCIIQWYWNIHSRFYSIDTINYKYIWKTNYYLNKREFKFNLNLKERKWKHIQRGTNSELYFWNRPLFK